jgi:hypothetical protein
MALVVIVGTIAVPRIAALLAAVRLPLAARQLAADLCLARATAVLGNTRARVTFSGATYTVLVEREHIEAPERRVTLPAGVWVAELPASGAFRFFPTGLADNGTVILTGAAGRRRSVVVNQRGRVSVR